MKNGGHVLNDIVLVWCCSMQCFDK